MMVANEKEIMKCRKKRKETQGAHTVMTTVEVHGAIHAWCHMHAPLKSNFLIVKNVLQLYLLHISL
jgi:hypothetical protein